MLGKQSILSTRRQDQGPPTPGTQPHAASPSLGNEEIRGFPAPASFHQNRPAETEPAAVAQPAPQAPAPAPVAGESTIQPKRLSVGNGVRLKGAAIEDCDALIVEGQVEATIDCRTLHVAADGIYRGKATVNNAEIQGRFEGELQVRERLVLRAGGHIAGKICYGKLLVEEGGVLGGEITTLEAEQEKRNMSVTRLASAATAAAVSAAERSAG
jgi:cytoskeletal protein CcmA (bactofilin family)